jgi:dUTP pyrophosphatase
MSDMIADFENSVETDRYMLLNLYVNDENDEQVLKSIYKEAAKNHNSKIIAEPQFFDAGFDLFLPKNINETYNTFFPNYETTKVDFKVKCSAKMVLLGDNEKKEFYTAYYTYARSSISKTPVRLANNQGIIDAGYRGNIIGMFDCLKKPGSSNEYVMGPYTRILQVCSPTLCPIFVNIVNDVLNLSCETSRGEGGVGSTGL